MTSSKLNMVSVYLQPLNLSARQLANLKFKIYDLFYKTRPGFYSILAQILVEKWVNSYYF